MGRKFLPSIPTLVECRLERLPVCRSIYVRHELALKCCCCSEFTTNKSLYLTIDTDACKGLENQINFLEHVQAFITLKATRRGDVTLYLVSPMNTT